MTQRWLPVVGYEPYYEVSDSGDVRSLRTGRLLKPYTNAGGYTKYGLTVGGVTRQYSAHRLVALAFIGAPTGPLVRHLDGNPANNAVANLAYGDKRDNALDAKRHGTLNNGHQDITHCPQGHLYDSDTTYYDRNGGRDCRPCRREACRRYRARNRDSYLQQQRERRRNKREQSA